MERVRNCFHLMAKQLWQSTESRQDQHGLDAISQISINAQHSVDFLEQMEEVHVLNRCHGLIDGFKDVVWLNTSNPSRSVSLNAGPQNQRMTQTRAATVVVTHQGQGQRRKHKNVLLR